MKENGKNIAAIVLNYNSWQDTIECVTLLLKQNWPDFTVVVVDNVSSDGSVEKIKVEWTSGSGVKYLAEYKKDQAEVGGVAEKEDDLSKYRSGEKVVLIKNDKNLGYSAGNNVGIRYAMSKGADAVLIVNPDVRIEDPSFLRKMVDVMFLSDDTYVVGPNVIDAKGKRQSPLREPSFIEECINPFLSAIKKPIDYLLPIKSDRPFDVEKVSGSCLLMRTSFLKKIGLLDENVFLYCEEPILSAQVKKYKGEIVFVPSVAVVHLHKKPCNLKMKEFFKSRMYYLKYYKKYNVIQLTLIALIHKLLRILMFIRRS